MSDWKHRFKCRYCLSYKPAPSCDDDMPHACDDCWNEGSMSDEAQRFREKRDRAALTAKGGAK